MQGSQVYYDVRVEQMLRGRDQADEDGTLTITWPKSSDPAGAFLHYTEPYSTIEILPARSYFSDGLLESQVSCSCVLVVGVGDATITKVGSFLLGFLRRRQSVCSPHQPSPTFHQ